MPSFQPQPQPRRRVVAGALAVVALVATGPLSVGGVAAHASSPDQAAANAGRTSHATAGFSAAPISVRTAAGLRQWGLASDDAGTNYLGFIYHNESAGQDVFHLSVLGDGQIEGNFGNSLSMPASGNSRLEVVTSGIGTATLFWLADTTTGTVVQSATYSSGSLGSPVTSDIVAPTGSRLLAATLGPDGKIWTVIGGGADSKTVTVRDGDQPTGTVLTTPYAAIDARLAFDSTGDGVLAVVPTNQVTKQVAYSVSHGGAGWGAFVTAPHTWNVGDAFGLVGGQSGIHLVSSTDASSYHPVVTALSGSSFATPHLTGDVNSCAPESHDLSTDASGRVADVSAVCNKLRLANLPDAAHEGYVDLASGGVLAGGQPQLTSRADGTGWVAWAIEDGSVGDKLLVAPVLLPAAVTSQAQHSHAGSVTVTGPRSCLPPDDVRVSATAKAAKGWKAGSPTLRLGSQPISGTTLHGDTLTPGKSYVLTASSVLTRHVRRHHHRHRHTVRSTVSSALTFVACREATVVY